MSRRLVIPEDVLQWMSRFEGTMHDLGRCGRLALGLPQRAHDLRRLMDRDAKELNARRINWMRSSPRVGGKGISTLKELREHWFNQNRQQVVRTVAGNRGEEEEEEEEQRLQVSRPVLEQELVSSVPFVQEVRRKFSEEEWVERYVKSYRPDSFRVAAAASREFPRGRLVCRTCDGTLSRGVRGVNLFQWNDNFHTGLNDELADTILYKPITEEEEASKSHWKYGKVACPCCGSNVGSLGIISQRFRVMFKKNNVAWRKARSFALSPIGGESSAESMSSSAVPAAVTNPVSTSSTSNASNWLMVSSINRTGFSCETPVTDSRPFGMMIASSWLRANAAVQTYSKRWILDSQALYKHIGSTGPQTVEKEIVFEPVVRSSNGESLEMTRLMKSRALRSLAFEYIQLRQLFKNDVEDFIRGLNVMIDRIREDEETNPRKETKTSPHPIEDRITNASGVVAVRFAAIGRLAHLEGYVTSTKDTSAVGQTRFVQPILDAAREDLKSQNSGLALVPARTLCAAARMFGERDDLDLIVAELARRKREFGPIAAAFGRSTESLKRAITASGKYDANEIEEVMKNATSAHGSPGGRFGVELDYVGGAEIMCSHDHHEVGHECNRRATHVAPALVNPYSSEPWYSAIPNLATHCRVHAPTGSLPAPEAHRGLGSITHGRPIGLNPSSVHRHGMHHPGQPKANVSPPPLVRSVPTSELWNWKAPSGGKSRKNVIVPVPDPDATTFGPQEDGTLHLGEKWQENIRVVYNADDLARAEMEFDRHIARAEKLALANKGVPSFETAIGIDCEWKPEFEFDARNNVCSTIQIATRDYAYVFDAISLGGSLDPLMRRLFGSNHILKVGHGLSEDLSRIAQFMGERMGRVDHSKAYFPMHSVMELGPLYMKAEEKTFSFGRQPSLALMVEAATAGLRLDKSCQMTDWERRPLSFSQVRYAATDAACVFLLLDNFVGKITAGSSSSSSFNPMKFISTDHGTTKPQRGSFNSPPPPFAKTMDVMHSEMGGGGGHGDGEVSKSQQPPTFRASHFSSAGRPAVGRAIALPKASLVTSKARQSHASRSSFSKRNHGKEYDRRVNDIRQTLLSQGVQVDKDSSLRGLTVAQTNLENELKKVVRDSFEIDDLRGYPPKF